MADAPEPRMTAVDQAFANVMIWLVLCPQRDASWSQIFAAEMRALIPQVSGHPRLRDMIAAAEALLVSDDWGARFHATAPVAEFVKWRAAVALDAVRAKKSEG